MLNCACLLSVTCVCSLVDSALLLVLGSPLSGRLPIHCSVPNVVLSVLYLRNIQCEVMFSGRYKTLWLDASDPDAIGDDETLATLKVSC